MSRIAGDVPVPNTPGRLKFAALGLGGAVGVGSALGLDWLFTGPERAAELEQADGEPVLDSRQATVIGMAVPFGIAAGVALGMQRRSPTAGLTTAQQLAAGAFLSSVAGAAINAGSDKAGDYVVGIGVTSAATGVGLLAGVRDEAHPVRTRMAGLGMFGVAMGVAAPMLAKSVAELPGSVQRSFEHRER